MSLKDFVGEMKVRARSFAFKPAFKAGDGFAELSEELSLKIVQNPEAHPMHNLVFYHPENIVKISIFHGSRSFKVSVNDSSAVKLLHQKGEISLIPIKLATVAVKIEDTKLERAEPIVSIVEILQAKRATLRVSLSLLQEQSTAEAEVLVYPKDHNTDTPFPQSQHRFMNISLELESESSLAKRTEAFKVEKLGKENNLYEIRCLKAGYFKIYAKIPNSIIFDNYPAVIDSNYVELHVYKRLEAHPSELLLAPGCTTNIELRGGPSEKSMIVKNIELRNSIDISGVVTMEKQRTHGLMYGVEAKSIGETALNFELIHLESSQVIAYLVVKARVALVNHMEISGFNEGKVHLGATIRLIAMSKHL
jgi:hypothetical protein